MTHNEEIFPSFSTWATSIFFFRFRFAELKTKTNACLLSVSLYNIFARLHQSESRSLSCCLSRKVIPMQLYLLLLLLFFFTDMNGYEKSKSTKVFFTV